MLDPAVAARLRETLISIGGGYLRNPVRVRGITCADCVTLVDGVGDFVTHWAIVPSLSVKPGEHPLRSLANGHAAGSEIVLEATASPARPREINPAHFMSAVQLPQLSYVLLIDDTWASGGHAQSAVLALRKAGADKVSVLVVARWLKSDFASSKEFVRQLAAQNYDPGVCPWTGGTCS